VAAGPGDDAAGRLLPAAEEPPPDRPGPGLASLAHRLLDGLGRGAARDLSSRGAAHAIAHREREPAGGARDQEAVLVAGTRQARIAASGDLRADGAGKNGVGGLHQNNMALKLKLSTVSDRGRFDN